MSLIPLLVAVVMLAAVLLGLGLLLPRLHRKLNQGQVLIITGNRPEPRVSFHSTMVFPGLQHAEIMDVSLKTVVVDFSEGRGMRCGDGLRVRIKLSFFLRVNPTTEDVLSVARTLGCTRAGDAKALQELFGARFANAVQAGVDDLNFEQLSEQRELFKDHLLNRIGTDLNGFVIDQVVVDSLEQTPLEALDPQNVLDAETIRRIKIMIS